MKVKQVALGLMFFCLTSVHAAPAAAPSAGEVVNFNQANEQQLASLKGVGQKRAAAIVAYRQAHGKFQNLQDVAAVPGISKKMLDKINQQNEHRISF